MFVNNEQINEAYAGYAPAFVRRVREKRKREAEALARKAKEIEQAAAKRRLREGIEAARRAAMAERREARAREMKAMEAELERLEEIAERKMEAIRTIDRANEALSRLRGGNGWGTMSRVVSRICRATGVTRGELLSDRRNKEVVFARQAVFYWSQRLTKMSLPEIGRRMGGRDHTTVLHGARTYPQKRAKMGRHLRKAR